MTRENEMNIEDDIDHKVIQRKVEKGEQEEENSLNSFQTQKSITWANKISNSIYLKWHSIMVLLRGES